MSLEEGMQGMPPGETVEAAQHDTAAAQHAALTHLLTALTTPSAPLAHEHAQQHEQAPVQMQAPEAVMHQAVAMDPQQAAAMDAQQAMALAQHMAEVPGHQMQDMQSQQLQDAHVHHVADMTSQQMQEVHAQQLQDMQAQHLHEVQTQTVQTEVQTDQSGLAAPNMVPQLPTQPAMPNPNFGSLGGLILLPAGALPMQFQNMAGLQIAPYFIPPVPTANAAPANGTSTPAASTDPNAATNQYQNSAQQAAPQNTQPQPQPTFDFAAYLAALARGLMPQAQGTDANSADATALAVQNLQQLLSSGALPLAFAVPAPVPMQQAPSTGTPPQNTKKSGSRSASESKRDGEPRFRDPRPIPNLPHLKGMCHVEGCNTDLTSLSGYYQRYRTCELHLKAASVLKDGIQQRFCQQCGRFHPVEDFDGPKRSCRARLQSHNLRRRKKQDGDGGEQGDQQTAAQHQPPLAQEAVPAGTAYGPMDGVIMLPPTIDVPTAAQDMMVPTHMHMQMSMGMPMPVPHMQQDAMVPATQMQPTAMAIAAPVEVMQAPANEHEEDPTAPKTKKAKRAASQSVPTAQAGGVHGLDLLTNAIESLHSRTANEGIKQVMEGFATQHLQQLDPAAAAAAAAYAMPSTDVTMHGMTQMPAPQAHEHGVLPVGEAAGLPPVMIQQQ